MMTEPAIDGSRSTPDCVEAVERAAKLLESLGHEVTDESPFDVLPDRGGGIDIEDSFLTRWAAGQAAVADADRDAPRPRARPRTTSSR